jgi:hypothetical protein
MRILKSSLKKQITSNKETQQLAKSWVEGKKKLEKKIVAEKNKKERAKLEIYHTFFLNNEFDKKQGTIKEKS